jgi:hypothetical protein
LPWLYLLSADDDAYACNVCHKRFSTVKDCKYHKQTVHLGQHRYKCEVCNRGFHSLTRLCNHKCGWGTKGATKKRKKSQAPIADPRKERDDREPAICRQWNKSKAKTSTTVTYNEHGEVVANEPAFQLAEGHPLEIIVTGLNDKKEVTYVVKPSEKNAA